jgi:hypothetical protein
VPATPKNTVRVSHTMCSLALAGSPKQSGSGRRSASRLRLRCRTDVLHRKDYNFWTM